MFRTFSDSDFFATALFTCFAEAVENSPVTALKLLNWTSEEGVGTAVRDDGLPKETRKQIQETSSTEPKFLTMYLNTRI
jgi:hypothetical protein